MVKVLIFGGCGFIGRNLAFQLVEKGFEITVFDKNVNINNNYYKFKINIIKGDILDFELVDETVKNQKYVFNFCAIKDITESNKNSYKTANVNIMGNINILEACKKHNMKRFLYASSLYAASNYWGGFYGTSKASSELFIEKL